MFEIDVDSEAGKCLQSFLTNGDTYKVSIDVRVGGIAIKRNEGMWTATLSTEA